MSSTDNQKNMFEKHESTILGWRKQKPICYYIMKMCIDKFLSKNKSVPKKLLTDYKQASVGLRGHITKNMARTLEENKKENTQLEELFRYAYNEYKHDTAGKGQCYITCPNNSFDNDDFTGFIKQKEDAVAFCYNKHTKQFNWADKTQIGDQFKVFKNEIKNSEMTCTVNNNKTHELGVSKWHSVCIQWLPLEKNTIDPGALHVFRYHVCGYVYFFSSKSNRDNMFKYLNK